MKNVVMVLGLGLLLSACGQGPAATPNLATLSSRALPDGATACFYTDIDFQGGRLCASGDRAWVGRRWNDRISSVQLAPGYSVQLFRDVNYGGGAVALEADVTNLGSLGFNDQTSSFKISKNGGGVTDTTPPTVRSVTASRTTIDTPEPVTLSADVTDDVGVSRVEFYVGDRKIGEATGAPYTATFDPTGVPNGTYSFSARAFDAAGNNSTGGGGVLQINFTTDQDRTPPTGSNLTLSTYSITSADPVTASVDASDNVGVARVEFYIGPYKVAEATSAPYRATFSPTTGVLNGVATPIPNGDYTARAVVYDAAGNSTQVPGLAVLVLLSK